MGHIAGCYLAADIFARYHRMKGNEVLMVSGSDAHGTPITIRADQEGVEPQEVLERYHEQFLDTWKRLGISFDLFTSTHTANHQEVVQDFFLRLKEQGYIYPDTMLLAYCAGCDRYLPDRYVEGTCPHCRNERARGDQCDNCGHTLDPIELVDPFCSICRDTPSFRDSEHFFLKLSAFQEPLLDWVNQQPHWRPNVANSTRSFLQGGLKDRAITRDLTWGVPVPLEGYDDKRIYVWFEAVIGYLSAAVEWASRSGRTDAWTDYWKGGNARAYYFIGKDNIPFHSIIWPAMLMGYGGLNLPYDVPANEFLSLESRKFSTSQNWAIWVPDYLDRYDPDPLRYLLSINMPETGDTDFTWSEFVRRNNDELVATYGNLVNRVLRFTYRNFDGQVPVDAAAPEDAERALLQSTRDAMAAVDDSLAHTRFRAGVSQAFGLAQECNRYLDGRAPWQAIKTDRADAARALGTTIQALNCLKVMLAPYLPFSSQKLHEFLGFDGDVTNEPWNSDALITAIKPGGFLRNPSNLYAKLDDNVAEQEAAELGVSV
ncbi:Methionine--tRNA ligase [Geodia barretti]|uniref:Methionine--tRNA ligase, cytoplasmic n=1 Tax=Geodia barretti TaxID=519541 RepID=A0AA35WLG1_GEOBA|nr:Methionine--tRNA ligase [Geodia barretti]